MTEAASSGANKETVLAAVQPGEHLHAKV